MATRRSPTARHRRLIVELKRLREEQGLTREQVAERIGTSETSIFRYEKGETRPQPAVAAAMLDLYGARSAERDELLEMARDARKRGWWHRHRQSLKPGFDSYIGLEAAASVVRTYEAQTVPGLLQTEAYARANIEATSANVVPARSRRRSASGSPGKTWSPGPPTGFRWSRSWTRRCCAARSAAPGPCKSSSGT